VVKILQAITSVDPASGGPIAAIEQLSLAHCAWGHTVEVACLDDPHAPWVAASPLKVHALGPGRTSYAFSSRYGPWLREHARRFDCIVVNGLWQYTGFGVWLHRASVPYFVFPHGMLDPYFKRAFPLKHLKKWLYWPWAEYRVLRDARAVLFTAQAEKLLARESFWLYRCCEAVTSLGTAPPPGDSRAQKALFFERFPGLVGRRLVLFLGRLHPKKGCDLLIEAFARVASSDPSLALVMAGPDQVGWQVTLVALAERFGIAGRVHWTGMLSGDLKWGALHAAEVFALPSHQENFGVAVAEALACGLPVLLSDRVNIWREIAADGAGLVAADSLSGTIGLLEQWQALSPAERRFKAECASQCFAGRFEIARAAQDFLNVLESNGIG
jgi:glycosyltransferase involved in cell wall biosynthesis